MEYRNCLIEKANRSLNIKMGGSGDYLEKDIDIEVVKKIVKSGSKEKAEEIETKEIREIKDRKYIYSETTEGKVLSKINRLISNIVEKIKTTFK